ncbi:MAG: hypothetical protein M3Q07_26110, partial [Pseudobdellovibrionaceae bacterium]|nr:hypothetical protein [Pseudobdellovibrionaceae bacterium]
KQSFLDEANLICPNQTPAPLLTTLLNNAFAGVGEPVIQNILIQETPATQTTQITVAYAMKIPKPPVPTLLGEEKHVPAAYSVDPLTIRPKFAAPVPNLGDADTAFSVEQRTIVNAAVEFDDISTHDLKLYRMHPNNFDFFAAVRTLRAPSEQFKKAVVLRGVMRDPANPNGSISITVLNFVMNSREQHERVVEAFSAFIIADLKALYTVQSK